MSTSRYIDRRPTHDQLQPPTYLGRRTPHLPQPMRLSIGHRVRIDAERPVVGHQLGSPGGLENHRLGGPNSAMHGLMSSTGVAVDRIEGRAPPPHLLDARPAARTPSYRCGWVGSWRAAPECHLPGQSAIAAGWRPPGPLPQGRHDRTRTRPPHGRTTAGPWWRRRREGRGRAGSSCSPDPNHHRGPPARSLCTTPIATISITTPPV